MIKQLATKPQIPFFPLILLLSVCSWELICSIVYHLQSVIDVCILSLRHMVEPKHVYHRNLITPESQRASHGNPCVIQCTYEMWSEEIFAQSKQLWLVPCIAGSQADAGLKLYLLNRSCYKDRLWCCENCAKKEKRRGMSRNKQSIGTQHIDKLVGALNVQCHLQQPFLLLLCDFCLTSGNDLMMSLYEGL